MSTKRPPTAAQTAADRVRCERDDLVTLLADIEALLPPPEGDDDGPVSRVRRVVVERSKFRTRADARDSLLTEIDAAVPGPGGILQRVRALAARHEHLVTLTTASDPATLSPRDRAILAPLLAIIDVHLFDNDGGRALAAVRAVVGVARG